MTDRQRNLRGALAIVLLVIGIVLANVFGRASRTPPTDAPASVVDEGPLPERASFLAFARDFESFRRWERFPVQGAMVPTGAEPGPTFVYRNARPSAGARAYPVGTILVKTIESGPPEDWVIHAMAKRGAPYNRDGAVGWEFFELDLDANDSLSVVWRGTSPPSGHGYGAQGRDAGVSATTLTCNDCHAASWQTDGVLTPALSLLPLPLHHDAGIR